MRVTRRRVIVDRHPVAEKSDDDEAVPDDRQRTAGHDASLVPEPPENRETAPSWRRGPRYNSALPAPAGAGQCRVLHRRAPDLLNSSQAHPEKPVTSRGFFGLCGYCAGARAGPAGLECGGNRTARARTAKEKKVAASIPWGMSKLPASPVDSRYLVPGGHGRDVSHRRCCRDLTVMVPVRRRRRRRAHKRPSGGNRLDRPAAFTLLTHLHFHDAPVGEALGRGRTLAAAPAELEHATGSHASRRRAGPRVQRRVACRVAHAARETHHSGLDAAVVAPGRRGTPL